MELIESLACSGVDDDTFTAVVSELRRLGRVASAAERLAAAVDAAEHYLPDSVVAAVGAYRLAALDTVNV